MGKHKKIINNDPILKKDYRYQKRKQQRALQKQEQRQRLQKQQKVKQEIAEIEHQVQQQMQKQLLKNATKIYKDKKIAKIPKQLFVKKQVEKNNIISNKVLYEKKQQINFELIDQNNKVDHYAIHFAQLSKNTQIVREFHESKKQQIDRQVKQQIKDMFSIQAGKEKQNKRSSNMEDQNQQRKNHKQKNGHHNEQQSYKNPYILIKSKNKQKQIVINNSQLNYFTYQAYQTKDSLIKSQNPQDIRKTVINSYKDYVHIQNKQQSTIQQFRKIVLQHMIKHENRCRQSKQNSKGFTNGKSVILCPFFGDAKSIIQIFQQFYPQYQKLNRQKLQQVQQQNDFFRIGISVNDRKKTIKYFSHFNVSNFIIGSPVGLKAIVGSQGQSQRDYSFLSSVQILYIDRASVIYMQNWDHLLQVIKSMNMMPNSQSICNSIVTLRQSVPQLMGKIYRQSIIFSQFNFPQINGLKNINFNNWQGCITTKIYYQPQICDKKQQFDINFYKMDINQPKHDLQVRFQFFKRKFWDQLHNTSSMNKIVIFTKSYFEFIKIKQFLIRVNASADYISQYTKKSKVQSKIAGFNVNKYRILLLTQRAYYFGLCQIKKLQHLYFYSLPINSFIYFELISQIIKQIKYVKNKVVAIYTKYDIMTLQKIVGSKKSIEMVKQYCSNVSFVL